MSKKWLVNQSDQTKVLDIVEHLLKKHRKAWEILANC